MNTHNTPGSWVVGTKSEYGTYNANMIFDSQDGSVAMVYGLPSNTTLEKMDDERYAEGKARARLIAAAPELLEAAEDAVNRITSQLKLLRCDDEFIAHEVQKLRFAITKATGAA
jgi:hypothetical protein